MDPKSDNLVWPTGDSLVLGTLYSSFKSWNDHQWEVVKIWNQYPWCSEGGFLANLVRIHIVLPLYHVLFSVQETKCWMIVVVWSVLAPPTRPICILIWLSHPVIAICFHKTKPKDFWALHIFPISVGVSKLQSIRYFTCMLSTALPFYRLSYK